MTVARSWNPNHGWVVVATLSLLSFALLGSVGSSVQSTYRYRSIAISLRLVGFGCAVRAVWGYGRDRHHGRVYGYQANLLEAVADVRTAYQSQIQQLHTEYSQQLTQWETAYHAVLAQLESLQHTQQQQQSEQNQQLQAEVQWLNDERDRLATESRMMWQHIEATQEALEQQQDQLSQQQVVLAEREAQFEIDLQQRIASEQAQLDEREAAMRQQFEAEWQRREEFFTRIANEAITQYEASKTPDYPPGTTPEELLARDAIRCLEQWSIIAKKPIVTPRPGKAFALSFEVFPVLADGTIQAPIRSTTEALKLIQKEVLPALKLAVPSCGKLPTVQPVSDLRLELTFDISGVDWEAMAQQQQERQQQVVEPPPEHLIHFVQANPHINVMADSGSGKTTLLTNLTAIAQAELGPDTTLIGVNPKPNADVELKTLKYIGFEESIYGLLEAAAEIYYRVERNNAIIRANRQRSPEHRQSLPTWSPRLYLIDEYTELMGVWNNCKPNVMAEVLEDFTRRLPPEKRDVMALIAKRVSHTSFAGDLTRLCWRVGRSEQVKLIIAGQNLKANIFKANIQDIQQQAYIYAGQAILEGIENRIQPWHKDQIRDTYALRENLVLAQKISKYYGLFVPKDGAPYFAQFPKLNQYSSLVSPEITADSAPTLNPNQGDRVPTAETRESPNDVSPATTARIDSEALSGELLNHLNACWSQDISDPDTPNTSDPNTSDLPSDHQWTPEKSDPEITGDPILFDPLQPQRSSALVEAVMVAWITHQSQNKVIEKVWGIAKGGKSKKYRAAKYHFRQILHQLDILLPGKPWGDDPDDHRSFGEIIA